MHFVQLCTEDVKLILLKKRLPCECAAVILQRVRIPAAGSAGIAGDGGDPGEGIACDGRRMAKKADLRESGAAVEGLRLDPHDTCGQTDLGQGCALMKSGVADLSKTGVELH